jgi:hypothetical protein
MELAVELNPIALVLAVAFAIPAFFRGREATRYWRTPSMRPPQPPMLGRFAPDVRRALERTATLYAVVMGSIAAMLLAGAFLPAGTGGSQAPFTLATGIATACFLVALIGMFAAVGLTVTVVWFNWPSFVVPPHRRTDIGVRALRRHAQGDRPDGSNTR